MIDIREHGGSFGGGTELKSDYFVTDYVKADGDINPGSFVSPSNFELKSMQVPITIGSSGETNYVSVRTLRKGKFVVFWRHNTDGNSYVAVCSLNSADGTITVGVPIAISLTSLGFYSRIFKINETDFLICSGSGSNGSLLLCRVNDDDTVTTFNEYVITKYSNDFRLIYLSDNNWLLAYRGTPSTTNSTYILCRVININDTSITVSDELELVSNSNYNAYSIAKISDNKFILVVSYSGITHCFTKQIDLTNNKITTISSISFSISSLSYTDILPITNNKFLLFISGTGDDFRILNLYVSNDGSVIYNSSHSFGTDAPSNYWNDFELPCKKGLPLLCRYSGYKLARQIVIFNENSFTTLKQTDTTGLTDFNSYKYATTVMDFGKEKSHIVANCDGTNICVFNEVWQLTVKDAYSLGKGTIDGIAMNKISDGNIGKVKLF